ncbi:MAG: tRNA (adenosine(37)-N6)-threonylcarbamoyltransferase complex dimerization subunit type 1 TsaB [Verrucomicrobia bacterium]|nr:tRNA (adenosine(37)-N6)-threonylcarbamoyltransferase complex dimerization subunit type 1 TsaB [Verrucomicrobiota bacterium]
MDIVVNRLVIENSGPTGSIVLARDHAIVLEKTFQGSAELARMADTTIKEIDRLDEIVVGIGPGSYTGLRVAVATALGMKLALGCRTFGCASVLGYPEENYLVIGDARRGAFFLAEIRAGKLPELPRLIPRADLGAEISRASLKRIFATSPAEELPDVEVMLPQARHLLGRDESFQDLREPIYLKEPHITQPK